MMKEKVKERVQAIKPGNFVTISNIISIFRAFLAFPILYCLKNGYPGTAFVIILIALLSDALDGWLARISHEITELGKILDPLADKVVILSIMMYMIMEKMLPLFYLIILVIRDLSIAILGVYLMNAKKVTPQSNKSGKVSIVFLAITLLAFLYDVGSVKYYFMWVSVFFMIVSWAQYFYTFVNQLRIERRI